MRRGLAPIGPAHAAKPAQPAADATATSPRPQIDRGAKHHPSAQARANRPQGRPPALHRIDQKPQRDSQCQRPAQGQQAAPDLGPFPRHHRPHGQDQRQEHHKGREGRIKERLPHRQFPVPQHLGHKGPDRADEDHETRHRQKHVIGQKRALAADDGKQPLGLQRAGAEGKKRQRAAHEHAKDHQNEHAAFGVIGKGMHRCDDARAHDEGADQRKAKGHDGQKNGPSLQAFTLFHHNGTVQQGGGNQPRHETRVFHRVPEPKAAPAQLIIGPPGPERDPDGQEHPSRQRPRPHPTRPSRVHPPLNQCGHCKGEGHRKADIAQIQEGRMKGQTGVLQQGVQVVAIQRRICQAQEGVRGEEHKGQERHTDHALHGQNPRLQRGRQVVAKPYRTGAKQRQGQRPQEQTALMVAPNAGNLVQHRLVGV